MTNATHPLSREHLRTAFGRLMPRLTDGMRRLVEPLLDLIGEDGSASVQQIHARLFPATDSTKSASAQLNNVLKAISTAAQTSGLVLSHQFEGSKQGGIAGRKLRFLGPPPLLVAETETLSAIEPAQRIHDQQGDPLVQEHRVVLLTFNAHEFNAVRSAFCSDTQTTPQTLPYPLRGRSPVLVDVLGSFGNIRLFHHHSRQGNRESQRAAADIHAALQPRAIVAVGIAFGAEEGKQAIADVLVSKFVVDYELGKVHKDGSLSLRGTRPPASRTWVRALEQLDMRHNASAAKTTWPRLHFGGLLSGEKLVDHIDYRNRLLDLAHQDDIVGGEMEAAGLFTALDGTQTEWLVVKAICDWADGNKTQDKERRQQHAAANAAQVVHALITSGSLYPDPFQKEPDSHRGAARMRPPIQLVDAKELMRRARLSEIDGSALPYEPNRGSQVSLDTLDEEAQQLKAVPNQDDSALVAFDDILQWANDPDSPPLYALLGEYGMGKTTTSQRVFEHLRALHLRGEQARPALYFDLRKVERLVPASDQSPGSVPSLKETVEDCLKNGYVSDGMQDPTYADVVSSIDQGAVVIFDGLDEVLSRIQDRQGLTFTSNLLRVLADAKARRPADASAPPPKLLLSCRTQFFRSLREQNNHLTGEHRGAQPARQYRALVLRPFTEPQIRAYLQAALPNTDIDEVMERIASVHNLTDLSKRPFTLKLVSRFLPQIERWQAEGRKITGATLYREVAREWLIRDKEKQSFQPEEKERLAADLAAHLWHKKQRGLDAPALEAWLGEWLARQPAGADCLTKARNLLEQDLRNATFLRRTDDGGKSRFEFSHSSLQEFFLAEHLARQVLSELTAPSETLVQSGGPASWAGPAVSAETLDFLGQILSEQPDPSAVAGVFNRWRKSYHAGASENLLRYALLSPQEAPKPLLAGFDLRGAQLSGWTFGNPEPEPADPLLNMQACLLQGADLRKARFHHVRLDGANFSGARLHQASFEDCRLPQTRWAAAQLVGTVFRASDLRCCDLEAAQAYRAQRVDCKGAFPEGSAEALNEMPAAWLAPPTHQPQALARHRLAWLPGHAGPVNAVAFSPDGQRIATASADSTLRLWDTASGEALLTLQGHRGWVMSVAFSPDGQRIASASDDRTLRLWDAASGEALLTLQGHQGAVRSVAFSPDGQRIASASDDRTLRLWDAASGEALLTLQGHRGTVSSVAFSPSGQRIASASHDRTLRLWDAASGETLHTLQGHQGSVSSVAFSPDGQRIVSASGDRTLRLWDATSGETLHTLHGHQQLVLYVAFSPDGQGIASASDDRTLRLWDAASGETLLTLKDRQGSFTAVAFSPDGQRIASASTDLSLHLWDAASGETLLTLQGHRGSVFSVAFSPDGQRIVSASGDTTLRLWDAASGEDLLTLQGHQGWVTAVAYSPDGQRIASASGDHTLRLWDAASGETLLTLQGHRDWVMSVAFSPDGQRIASASADNMLRLWDAASGQALLTLRGHQGAVRSVAFSPDGQRIASVSDDRTLRLWDAASGEALLTLQGHQGWVTAVAFSPDGRHIASASDDHTLRLWDAATGGAQLTLQGHQGRVTSVAFSPDGQRIASASDDNTLRLWDAASGEALLTLQGHQGPVLSVAFSPDGQRIASASDDSTLRLWDAASGAWLRSQWTGPRWGPHGHAFWVPPLVEPDHPEGRVISASGDAWRLLGWQVWDHPSAPGQWTRLPLGPYPGATAAK